jgi:hypothetical protein
MLLLWSNGNSAGSRGSLEKRVFLNLRRTVCLALCSYVHARINRQATGYGSTLREVYEFEDGEPMVIVYRGMDGQQHERQVEYCDPPIVLTTDGTACLHFYIYEPDGVTDLLPLDLVVGLHRRADD